METTEPTTDTLRFLVVDDAELPYQMFFGRHRAEEYIERYKDKLPKLRIWTINVLDGLS